MNTKPRIISNKENILNSILFFILFIIISTQNLSTMLISNIGKSLTMSIFAVKEIYMTIFLLLLFSLQLKRMKIKTNLLIPVLFSIYILFNSVLFSPYFNLLSLRQLMAIPFFVLFGYYFINKIDIIKIEVWVYKLLIIIALLACFERFLLNGNDYDFMKFIGVEKWTEMKGWGYNVPASWYSGDLRIIFNDKVRRMPGLLIGDAVNFGQLMLFPLMYSVFLKKNIMIILFGLAAILSLSKGAVIGFIIGYSVYLYREKLKLVNKIIFLVSIITISSIFIYQFLPQLEAIGSIKKHYLGWYSNILNLPENIFGAGIGSGGNFAIRFGQVGTSDAFNLSTQPQFETSHILLGESYFGTMISQLGIIGVLFYFYYPFKLLKINLPQYETFLKAAQYSILGLFFVGLFSETAFTYIGTGMIIVFIPFIINYNKSSNYEKQIY